MSPTINLELQPRARRRAAPPRPLTLRLLQRVLADVEAEEGVVVARRLAAALDYGRLTELARRGPREPENDAQQLDPRYLLLWGMSGPEVLTLQESLVSLGYPAPRTGRYDDATLLQYWAYLIEVGRAGARRED